MKTTIIKPLLEIGNIWNYYDFLKYNYLFHIENNSEKTKRITALGVDFGRVKKCCLQYGISEQQHGFFMGIVHLFFDGYQSAIWFELEYKPNSNRLKEQMEQILNIDLDQITEIVIKTDKLETIKLDKGLTTFTIIAALREMKENLRPDKVDLYGNRSYYKTYVYTHLMPFYQFLIDQSFFSTKTEARQFIIDLCECFNLEWEHKLKISDPVDYLKDRFKEKKQHK